MVGSTLLMNMASCFLPSCIYSDLDGQLLIDDESNPFYRGFKWDLDKGIILGNDYGIGVKVKDGFFEV